MRQFRLVSLAMALAAGCVGGASADGTWRRGAVVSVTVGQVGAGDEERDPAGDPEPCTRFRPTAEDVRAYFNRARRLTQRQHLYETTWTSCYALGRLRLKDGRNGEWVVRRGGSGAVTLGERTFYFDCQSCRSRLETKPP